MPATALDSLIFRDIFSTESHAAGVFRRAAHRLLLGDRGRARARAGPARHHPAEAAREIDAKCRIENIDLHKLKQQTERIGYPILGVVQQIVGLCADGLGEWCHWGATTQDITDTATVMQIRAALDLVEAEMEKIAACSRGLRAVIAIRRWRAAATCSRRCRSRSASRPRRYWPPCNATANALRELRPRVLVGEFAGAAGTLASLGADGLKVQAALMHELKLGQPEIAWHTVRDRIGEVGCFLGLLTGTLGKIAMDVKLLMQTEVAEAFEPFAQGRGSSSTMPQKRNPISSLYIHATAALVRQHAAALLEAAVADQSARPAPGRSSGSRCQRSFCSAPARWRRPGSWSRGLEVDAARMRANLDITHGTIVSEAVMMGWPVSGPPARA